MALNVEAEIRDLKRRVGELEGSFAFLTPQVQSVHKDLMTFQARTEQRFNAIDKQFGRVDSRFDKLERRFAGEINSLRKDLPAIVGDAVRGAIGSRDGRPKKPR